KAFPKVQALPDARAPFARADYRRLWAIGGLSGIARWLEFVAVAVFAYELTRSPELVALLAVLRMLPYLLIGFSIGVLADALGRAVAAELACRWSRTRLRP